MSKEQEDLLEDIAIILALAVLSDGNRQKIEEKLLFSSPLFTSKIKSNYYKFIKIIELLQTDDKTISIQFFTKIITYSDKLNNYPNKTELYQLLQGIVLSDKIETSSEKQFLEIVGKKWKTQ